MLAGFVEPLGEWTPGTIGSLDFPDSIRPGRGVGAHRGVAGLIGSEATRSEELLLLVDYLDRRGQLVGIDPDDDLIHALLPALVPVGTARWGIATTSWAVPS
jgi:hypothetical protein